MFTNCLSSIHWNLEGMRYITLNLSIHAPYWNLEGMRDITLNLSKHVPYWNLERMRDITLNLIWCLDVCVMSHT